MIKYDPILDKFCTADQEVKVTYNDPLLGELRYGDLPTDTFAKYDPLLGQLRTSTGAKWGYVTNAALSEEGTASGNINPKGISTTIKLQYSLSANMSSPTEITIGTFATTGSWSNPLANDLPAGEQFYWRYKATNSFGTTYTTTQGELLNVLRDANGIQLFDFNGSVLTYKAG